MPLWWAFKHNEVAFVVTASVAATFGGCSHRLRSFGLPTSPSLGCSMRTCAVPGYLVLMKLLMVDFSFSSQLVSYFVIICVLVAVFYCFLKQLADFSDTDQQTIRDQDARNNETEPILPRKRVVFSYGATGEQPESSMCSSECVCSEQVCKICYDAPRSCFFIPCGHGFACFTCARRIAEDKNQACPICRRLIHRVRRLVEGP